VRSFAGAFVPVGAQKANFKSATMVGGQLAVELTRHFHGVFSVSWTQSHNRLFTEDVTRIWQYDGGVEVNAVTGIGWGWYFRPFVGTGVGARTYDYKERLAKNTSCMAWYGGVGAELQYDAFALRGEVRDYLSCFQRPNSTERRVRNDFGLTVGLAYHLR
jgi:hypothetical protein